jgi:competence protein ComEA
MKTIRVRLALVAMILGMLLLLPAPLPAGEPLDLNSAPMNELVELPGIGPKRAEDIIRYRLTRGFRRKSDLLRIRGIGRRTYARLKALVQVKPLVQPEQQETSDPSAAEEAKEQK